VLVAFVLSQPRVALALVVPVVCGVAWYAWLRLRRKAPLGGIGVYDETLAADVLSHPGHPG
jgi:hypothetical protein